MKIKSWLLGLIVLVIIFGGIGGTMAFNLWQTKGSGEPARFNEGEFTGEYNPADIRGSHTFGSTSELFNISLAELEAAFGLEAIENLANLELNILEAAYANLEEDVEVGTDSVRVFVALYTSLPYTLADTTYLPQPAVEILKEKINLTGDQIAFLDTHVVDITGLQPGEIQTVEGEESTEQIIRGKTTFQDLLDWGVSKEEIEAAIGEKLPPAGTTIQDFAFQKEALEFGTLKETLQAKVDGLK